MSIARLGARARTAVDSDRGWSVAGAFANRIGGFVTSFVLARLGGAAVLGAYSAVANTAATVVAPALFAVTNGATIDAQQARERANISALLLAHAAVAALVGFACCAAYLAMSGGLGIETDSSFVAGVAIATGLVSVVSQLVAPALQGVLYGAGEFRRAAIASVITAGIAIGLAVPIVMSLGLAGGLLVLATSSLLLPALLIVIGLRLGPVGGHGAVVRCMRTARGQLMRSLPSVGATSIAAAASWATAIFIAHRTHGNAGVGVIAIGAQWLTLLLLVVTSWGGVTLRGLAIAFNAGPAAFRREIRTHVLHNARVTIVGAVVLAAVAELIARLYHAGDTALPAVLRVNACIAIVLAINNVAERALYCSNRQRAWLWTSTIGALVSVALAILLAPRGVVFVPIATLCGHAVTTALGFLVLRAP